MAKFPKNDIITLTGTTPRFELGASVSPDLRVKELLDDASRRELDELSLDYCSAAGDRRVRELVAQNHGVSADDVVLTVGGQQTLFLLAFLLCDKGDEAVTTSPLYPPARSVLEAVGANVRILPLSFESGYRIDVAALRELLSERTKLVSLASPQNPSGVAVPPDTIREVLDAMRERCPDAHLLLDETYREAAYGDDPIAPSCVTWSPKIISSASLSKCHGAPGLRSGWAITRDAALREQLILGKFNTVVSSSAVDEFLALRVLEQRDRILAERRVRLAEGLAIIERWVRANEEWVEWVRPNAGAICCVRLKPAVFDDAAVARFYEGLSACGVRVSNGTWFGEAPRVFRLGFGLLAPADLETALGLVSAAIDEAQAIVPMRG